MKTATKIYATIAAVLGLVGPQLTPVISNWVSAHPIIALAVSAVSLILGLVHNPSASA